MDSVFNLTWTVSAGVIATLVVGQSISTAIGIVAVLTKTVAAGQFQIDIGDSDGVVTGVTVNGASVSFTLQGNYVQFPVLVTDSVVEVRRTPAAIFSILNGTLPLGISFGSDGTLSGTVAHTVDIAPQTFAFTVRASVDGMVRDRAFSVVTSGVDAPTTFDSTNLPAPLTDPLSGLSYHPVGNFSRANHVSYSLPLDDADSVRSTITLVPAAGLPDVAGLYGGLPDGLSLVVDQIQGIVLSDAASGLYLFQVQIAGTTPQAQLFGIAVADTISDIVDIVPKIAWTTASGNIGTLSVGEPCYLSISAVPIYSPAIVFSLASDSDPLPPGLSLDATSGDITGVPSYIRATTEYTFTVRATSGALVDERTFVITISQPFKDTGPRQIVMPLPAVQAALLSAGDTSLIAASDVFRPANPQFGINALPSLFLIASLTSTPDVASLLTDDANAVGPGNYHKVKTLLLGDIASAVARGVDGTIVYEVVYRLLIDPQAGAGGFTVNASTPAVSSVNYFQNGSSTEVIYPNSILNARLDLATRIGFDTQPVSHVLGPAGPELMPLWMRSPQVAGDTTTIPGFVPALVIGYVKPGAGARTAAAIARSNKYVTVGTQVVFPKYLITSTANAVEIILPDIDRWS